MGTDGRDLQIGQVAARLPFKGRHERCLPIPQVIHTREIKSQQNGKVTPLSSSFQGKKYSSIGWKRMVAMQKCLDLPLQLKFLKWQVFLLETPEDQGAASSRSNFMLEENVSQNFKGTFLGVGCCGMCQALALRGT